ncbi:hypothetical protein BMR05_06345, partial [Methylococcaceae bacterium HT4]
TKIRFVIILILLTSLTAVNAAPAPPCKGPNKNDPGCPADVPVVVTSPPVKINSAYIEWFDIKIVVTGDFDFDFTIPATTVTLSGITPINPENVSSSSFEIPFDSDTAGIAGKGNHRLIVDDGTTSSEISLYIEGQIIDKDLIGCPCADADAWSDQLGAALWNPTTKRFTIHGIIIALPTRIHIEPKTVACLELNIAQHKDIAGTISSDPDTPNTYPLYTIGAAFTDLPKESVCRLTRIDNIGGPATDLVNIRINKTQQIDYCRDVIANNICATVNDSTIE